MAMNNRIKKTTVVAFALGLLASGIAHAAVDIQKFNKALKTGNWIVAKSIIQDAYKTPGQFKLARQLEQQYVEAEIKAQEEEESIFNIDGKDFFEEENEPTEKPRDGNGGGNGGGKVEEEEEIIREEEEIKEEKGGGFGGEITEEKVNELLNKELPTTEKEQQAQTKELNATLTNLQKEIEKEQKESAGKENSKLQQLKIQKEQLKEQENKVKQQKVAA